MAWLNCPVALPARHVVGAARAQDVKGEQAGTSCPGWPSSAALPRTRGRDVRSMFARMSRHGPLAAGSARHRLSRFAVPPGTSYPWPGTTRR